MERRDPTEDTIEEESESESGEEDSEGSNTEEDGDSSDKNESDSASSDGEDDEADEEDTEEPTSLKPYWDFIASKYQSQLYEPNKLMQPRIDTLPSHWTVVSITLASDENTLFLTRQRANSESLIFCVPLKNRRDADDEEEDKLTYRDAMDELNEIIRLSDEGTRGAVNVKRDDKNARAKWWASRSDLDKRLKTFLENLEFCWLGAFKVRGLFYKGLITEKPNPLP